MRKIIVHSIIILIFGGILYYTNSIPLSKLRNSPFGFLVQKIEITDGIFITSATGRYIPIFERPGLFTGNTIIIENDRPYELDKTTARGEHSIIYRLANGVDLFNALCLAIIVTTLIYYFIDLNAKNENTTAPLDTSKN